MILRIDRLGTELPPPSDPDPAGAAAVQELMGGRYGEMSTLMNYTFQSFNFRDRQGARPFYDLLCNIAAEEYGHIELVAAAINTMLTGASPIDDGRAPSASLSQVKGIGNPQHFIAGGQGALPQDSNGKPWNGDYVFSSRILHPFLGWLESWTLVIASVLISLIGALLIGVLANSVYVDAISTHFGFNTNVSWGGSYWGFNTSLAALPRGLSLESEPRADLYLPLREGRVGDRPRRLTIVDVVVG